MGMGLYLPADVELIVPCNAIQSHYGRRGEGWHREAELKFLLVFFFFYSRRSAIFCVSLPHWKAETRKERSCFIRSTEQGQIVCQSGHQSCSRGC